MVFVTVGNATQQFSRLLNAVDEAVGKGMFEDEQVLIQSGNNPDFQASHCQQEAFMEMSRFESLLKNSSLVISHGGAGTLLNVLQAGRVPVVMPRRQQYSEHVDDHQVELVRELAKFGRVVPAFEAADMPRSIREARCRNGQPSALGNSQLVTLVAQALKELIRPAS